MLEIRDISKTYQGAPLLHDLSFAIAAGEIVCLLGPSGTGKTTLLRIIAGLEEADAGDVLFQEQNLRGVPPHERGFGFMFQDLALFPHRNVFDNIAFGLRMLMPPPSRAEIAQRVNETLALVGLDATVFARRDVNRLSGGEQQRVALARTLAPRPRLVMFDEPLGALDRILREELAGELRALLKRLHMTALYVTHDQDEAFTIADRLLLLHAGRIEQSGTPVEIYTHPASMFVARFVGLTNLVPARVITADDGQSRAQTPIGTFDFANARAVKPGEEGYLLLRPTAARARVAAAGNTKNILSGNVVEAQLRGGHTRLLLACGDWNLTLEWDDAEAVIGQPVMFELDPQKLSMLRE
jgi:ABC-type Fe3+/spermidine/putrescine transport system ATPase subunit